MFSNELAESACFCAGGTVTKVFDMLMLASFLFGCLLYSLLLSLVETIFESRGV